MQLQSYFVTVHTRGGYRTSLGQDKSGAGQVWAGQGWGRTSLGQDKAGAGQGKADTDRNTRE